MQQDTARSVTYVIANNSVFASFQVPAKAGGAENPWGPEVLITPSTNTVQNVCGVRFRSAVAGAPARVIAQLIGADDPQIAGGTPFGQTLTAAGAVGNVGILDRVTADVDINTSAA